MSMFVTKMLDAERMKVLSRHNQCGAALVELTIVLVLFLVPLLIGVIEVGRLIYTYKTIVHQVHHTARYLSVQEPGTNLDAAICLFKTGKLEYSCLSSDELLMGFRDSTFDLSIEDAGSSNAKRGISTGNASYPASVNVVTVTANNYPHKFIFTDFLNLNSVVFGPVSATFRQVN